MSHERNRVADKKNPQVFMDVSIKGVDAGRMTFELFKDVAPITAENFRALCTGEKGMCKHYGLPLHYKGSFFYPIWEDYSIVKCGESRSIVKGGDFFSEYGHCGESIYGAEFPDEEPHLQHCERGLLSMAIADRFGIGSHFVITLKGDHSLDRFHVVFGKLIGGFGTLKKLENASFEEPVWVFNCGECNGVDEEQKQRTHSQLKNERAQAAAKLPRPILQPGNYANKRKGRSEEKCSCCSTPLELFDIADLGLFD